jgi:tripartite-type tricarboxylate transporter receptor subunit TctC
MFKLIARTAVVAAGLLAASVAGADPSYPNKPIKFIVAYAPGGGTDVIARVVGRELSKAWNTPVVVENRPGAGSNIGTQAVAKAEPDGYTLLVTSTPFAINPTLYKNAGYTTKDFAAVINAGHSATILVVPPSVAANNLQELIDLSKTQPLSYASAGIGTVPFFTAEYLLKKKAGINIVHVPYGGAGPAVTAVVAGHVPVGILALATPGLEGWISSGKLKAITVTSRKRVASLPNVPTASESGFPGYVDLTWIGFAAPAKTPPEIVNKLNKEMNRILELPEVKQQLTKLGFEWEPNTAAEFTKFLQDESVRWAEIVKTTGAQAD